MSGGLLILSHPLFQKVTDQASSITSPVKDCYIFNILIILKCSITVNIFLSIRNGDCLLRQSPNELRSGSKSHGRNIPKPNNPTYAIRKQFRFTYDLIRFFTYRVTEPSYMKPLVISFYTELIKLYGAGVWTRTIISMTLTQGQS